MERKILIEKLRALTSGNVSKFEEESEARVKQRELLSEVLDTRIQVVGDDKIITVWDLISRIKQRG